MHARITHTTFVIITVSFKKLFAKEQMVESVAAAKKYVSTRLNKSTFDQSAGNITLDWIERKPFNIFPFV